VMSGGNDVPIVKIVHRYYKSIAYCEDVSPIVDRLYVYDNSTENEPAKLLFRADEGKLVKQYFNIADWASGIFNKVNGRF